MRTTPCFVGVKGSREPKEILIARMLVKSLVRVPPNQGYFCGIPIALVMPITVCVKSKTFRELFKKKAIQTLKNNYNTCILSKSI